ncbi:LacI family DNA-binding transcriptional regulator [Domibacillus indicus]|uniref:LacI family DNA-binding transcriptional regulator n=1 Tax=Domibacillus indicus TaxID=1437523 RepID=UPI00203D1F4D|nr:LacI family DNA-binding transcriptional regulator [Domibacillus indicus]MCM3790835.1 LacI family DNA-binding transcriptional regulator [Domibacillus indicus]
MITIAEIAKMAGVAKSTVSRYLNDGSVSPVTKLKIERVIQKTEYVPNSFAQSLKAKVTNLVGVVVPRLDSYAASKTMIGIDQQLRELNLKMVVANSGLSVEREIENIYSLAKQKVAGLIVLPTVITKAHLEAFYKIDIPVLIVGQKHENLYCLVHPDEQAAFELGKYVISKGHKKIAFLGVAERDVAAGFKRKEGFKKAVGKENDIHIRFYETTFDTEDARNAAKNIISDFAPSIIVCATDNIALGAMKAAYDNGIKVPTDLSITGFGGYSISEYMSPGLTTVKFHYQLAGQMAAQNIHHLINHKEIKKCTTLKFEIFKRESVDKIK